MLLEIYIVTSWNILEFIFRIQIRVYILIYITEGVLSLINVGLASKEVDYLKINVVSIIHCGGEVRKYGEREHFQK